MERKYELSVIIPVFNSEKYIEECVESVIKQNVSNLEIICVNDGSTDNTVDVLNVLQERYDNVFVATQSNKGVSATRNLGLSMARGKYIFFIDSDDFLAPNWLKYALERCDKEQLDMLFFSFMNFYEDESLATIYKRAVNVNVRKGDYTDELVDGRTLLRTFENNGDFRVSPCIQIVRRKFIEDNQVRFCEGVVYEDALYMITLLLKAQRCICINKIWYKRRIRAGSIEHSEINANHLYGIFKGLPLIKRMCDDNDIDDETANAVGAYLKRRFKFLIRQYFKAKNEEREKFYSRLDSGDLLIYNMFVLPYIEMREKYRVKSKEVKVINDKNQALESDNEKLEDDKKALKTENKKLERENLKLEKRLDSLRNSYAFRIGRIFTAPARFFRKIFKKSNR